MAFASNVKRLKGEEKGTGEENKMKQNATKKNNELFCKIWKLNRTELQSEKIEKTDHKVEEV